MFLSDRKRRKYLSLSLPQNLSPKKLSFKDKGFLKRNIRNSLEPLSFPLAKQQKNIYEKHIFFPLKKNLYPFYKTSTHIGTLPFLLQNSSIILTQIHLSVWPSSKNMRFINCISKKPSGYMCISPRDKSTYFFSEKLYKKTPSISVAESVAHPQTFYTYKKNSYMNFAKQQKSKKNENMYIRFSENYRNLYNFLPENSDNNALCVYVQTTKTKNIDSAKVEKQRYNFYTTSFLKNCLLNPNLSFYFCQEFLSPPLFANGRNKYQDCRFLYNKEHIKASINPQITKQPHKKNKGFAKLLHERKKIMLFYGQIAKKDLRILCKKAKNIPGLFEDNIHILLESRVDVLVHRAGFSKSIAMARQLIRQGIVYVNGKKLCSCKILGKPGDIYTIGFQSNSYEMLQRAYTYTTTLLYNIYLSKGFKNFRVSQKKIIYRAYSDISSGVPQKSPLSIAQKSIFDISNPKGFFGNLYPGFFLYKNLCKKKIPTKSIAMGRAKNAFYDEGITKTSLFSHKQKNVLQYSIEQFFYRIAPLGLDFLFRPNSYKNAPSYRDKDGIRGIFLNVYIASILKYKVPVRKVYKATVKKECIFLPCIKNIQNANCALYWGQKPLHLEISHKTTSFIYLYKPQKLISPICIDFYAFKFFK